MIDTSVFAEHGNITKSVLFQGWLFPVVQYLSPRLGQQCTVAFDVYGELRGNCWRDAII